MAFSGVDKLDEYDTILPTIGSLAPHLCVIIEDLFRPIEVVKLSKLNALGALSLARKKFSFKMKTFYGTYLSYSLTRHHSSLTPSHNKWISLTWVPDQYAWGFDVSSIKTPELTNESNNLAAELN